MHLFLIETPGLNRMWHLHPSLSQSGKFHDDLPPIVAGNYKVFADVVDHYGFPWTFVATEELPAVSGAAMRGDDSSVSTDAIGSQMSATDKLADGTEVTWQRGDRPIRVNQTLLMKFAVKDPGGAPATDLQPYMGMSAHAEIVRSDFSVFAH